MSWLICRAQETQNLANRLLGNVAEELSGSFRQHAHQGPAGTGRGKVQCSLVGSAQTSHANSGVAYFYSANEPTERLKKRTSHRAPQPCGSRTRLAAPSSSASLLRIRKTWANCASPHQAPLSSPCRRRQSRAPCPRRPALGRICAQLQTPRRQSRVSGLPPPRMLCNLRRHPAIVREPPRRVLCCHCVAPLEGAPVAIPAAQTLNPTAHSRHHLRQRISHLTRLWGKFAACLLIYCM